MVAFSNGLTAAQQVPQTQDSSRKHMPARTRTLTLLNSLF